MPLLRPPRLRFSLKSLLILSIGVAIGYTLNLRTWRMLTGAPSEAWKVSLPTYVIEPPDILQIEITAADPAASPVCSGQHLVAMDGRVNIQGLGTVYVAGMTMAEAQDAIAKSVAASVKSPRVLVDVLAYNSKVYYVIERHPAGADDITRLPITGNETILDAIAAIGGLDAPSATELWISRGSPTAPGSELKLPVDWDEVANGDSLANLQILPGDRVFISQLPKSSPN